MDIRFRESTSSGGRGRAINLCGAIKEFRGDNEGIPRPRTAEELLAIRNRQEEERKRKSKSTGDVWQEDYLR